MTQAEIQALARAAGFSQQAAPIASAIAIAESSGNPRAFNPKPPDLSYGLWQINMIGRLGPERRARFGLRSNEDLFDPATNARAAYVISSRGSNFRPWTTYTSGAYKRYLTQGQIAAGQKQAASDGGAGSGLPIIDVGEPESGTANLSSLAIIAALLVTGFVLAG